MNRISTRVSGGLLAVALAATLLAGCGGESSESLLASAKGYLAKGETKSAIIQLKSALQKGETGEMRLLLGEALLSSGDPRSAEVELRKALGLKADEVKVAPLLAQAMLEQGRAKELIERFNATELTDREAQARLKTSLAWARAATGDRQGGAQAAQQALDAVPGHPAAVLFNARLRLAEGDADGALALVDEVISKSPREHDAWLLKGDILARAKQDAAGARQAYAKALESQPASRGAHTGLVLLDFAAKDWTAAGKQLEAMKKLRPGDLQVRFLEGRLALSRGDLKLAKELSDQLLKAAPSHPGVLLLAGGTEFQSRSYLQAQTHLHKLLAAAPQVRLARVLLAQSYARSGQPAKTLETIEPLIKSGAEDGEALSIAGEAYLQTGQVAEAEAAFQRASRINPDDPRSRTALALMKLSRGDADAAFGELETIARGDSGTAADLTLISAHLRRNEFDAALKNIDRLAAKTPDSALPVYLRGAAQLGLRRVDDARGSFEQALKLDPVHFPSIERLAALDAGAGQPARARSRLEALLKAVPGHVEGTAALAQLLTRQGAPADEVGALIGNAITLHPTDAKPRLLLVAHHLAGKRADKALSAAQEGLSAIPDHPQLLDALGQAQMASGDLNQAITSFNKLAALQPDSPLGPMRAADAYVANKNFDAARQSLKRAQAVAPNAMDLAQRVVGVELAAGQPAQALAAARAIHEQHPNSGVGRALEGDVEARTQRWDAAAAAYRASLAIQASTVVATKLHTVLLQGGKAAEARAMAQRWLADHPKDVIFPGYLGDRALAAKDFAGAEALYQRVLKQSPDDARALNNVAWIKTQTKAPGAVDYARRASGLRPDSVAIQDTLGLALLGEGRAAEAIAVLERASAAEPGNLPVKLSLARAYLQAGQKDQAKDILGKLRAAGDRFTQQDEVAKLLAAL